MHGLTPISIAGAATSLVVSPALIALVWRARTTGRFSKAPFVGFMLFESLFLVAYMTFLSFQPARTAAEPGPADATLGALHGVVALVVFIGFWALLPVGASAYRRGRNLFAERPGLTWTAIAVRVLAVVSGEAIFLLHLVT